MDDKIKLIEQKRVKVAAMAIVSGILAVVMVICFILFYFSTKSIMLVLMIISILITAGFGVFAHKARRKYIRYYKENFVSAAIEGLFKSPIYEPTRFINTSIIKSAHMVRMGNTISGDDYISARYRDIDFVHCDIHIQNQVYTGKTTTTQTYFKGKWMYFDFHKDFSEYVIIREKANVFEKAHHSTDYGEKIEFESIEFNKEFTVFATDQHTAFYLLTPHFIDSLNKLRDKTDGQLILGFVDGKLHIAINSGKNSLEPAVFKRITQASVDNIRNELQVITNFIDELLADKPDFKVSNNDYTSDYDEPVFDI